jgi:glutamyl-tRNA synthetase
MKPARTRFAPSPTGRLHIGGARTALYDYLLARQTGGQFILRLEDTDRKRFIPGAEEEIIHGLRWLGIAWDEGPDVGGPFGPYRQSERADLYLQYAKQLIAMDKAYYCFCSPERLERVRQEQHHAKLPPRYDRTCRHLDPDDAEKRVKNGEKYVIRFKMPDQGAITVRDTLRGEITVENRNLDDYVLVKSDGLALYHLAAMVDDFTMNITHVIRGSEWLPTFPLHAHIVRAFGWPEPEWVHLSVFLKPSGKGKMSKRESADLMKDGYSIFVRDLEDLGYLPEATVNWISLMGWSYDDHTEFFTLEDLVQKFSLSHLNPAPAAINFSKYDHFNGLHIRYLQTSDLARRIQPFFTKEGMEAPLPLLEKVAPIIQDRLGGLDDAPHLAGFFFREFFLPPVEQLIGKNLSVQESSKVLQMAVRSIESIDRFEIPNIENVLRKMVEELGLSAGQVFGILRMAVTGQVVSPPLFESMHIIGKETVLERLNMAYTALTNHAEGESSD